jgi:hypothetical protein
MNPNTSMYRKVPTATLLLDPERAAEVLAGRVNVPRAPAAEPARDAAPDAKAQGESAQDDEGDESQLPFVLEEETEDETRRIAQPREVAAVTAPCPYCGAGLPVGRTVLFCPHCGQNIGVVHCPTCCSELDVGWQFCITCGQKVTGLG